MAVLRSLQKIIFSTKAKLFFILAGSKIGVNIEVDFNQLEKLHAELNLQAPSISAVD